MGRCRSRSRCVGAAVVGLFLGAHAASGQAPPGVQEFGEAIEVRTGFVRVTIPVAAAGLKAEDVEVRWKGKRQPVLRVVGGSGEPVEVGIAVDRSASMHSTLEPMRRTLLNLVDRGFAERDRLFVVGFTDEARLLAEGRGDALRVLQTLPTDFYPGTRPTALFDALTRALQLFENADARTALLVASDGCDTSNGLASATSVARRARDMAIPIFLLLPERGECKKTTCRIDAAGEWDCSSRSEPSIVLNEPRLRGRPREMQVSTDGSGGMLSIERDRFIGQLAKSGGGVYVVRDAEEWRQAMNEIFERLGRQWTVVFEPTSEEVQSSEVRVDATLNGHRKRLQ